MSKHEGQGSSSIPVVLYLVPYHSSCRSTSAASAAHGSTTSRTKSSSNASRKSWYDHGRVSSTSPQRSCGVHMCLRVRVRACVRVCVARFRDAEPSNSNTQVRLLLAPGDETAQRPCQVGARPFRHAARPPATGSTSPTRCRHQQWRLGRGRAHSPHPPGCILCRVNRPCRFEWLPVRMAVTRVVV